jgi:hypothetical protein
MSQWRKLEWEGRVLYLILHRAYVLGKELQGAHFRI